MIRIAAAVLARLSGWSEDAWPQEACALLVGRLRPGAVVDLVRVERSRNLAEQPETGFEIDLGLRMGLERELRHDGLSPQEPAEPRLVGLWHSHPDGPAQPSERDRLAVREDLVWLLTAVAAGRAVQTCAFRPVLARGWALGATEPRQGWPAAGFLPEPLVVTGGEPT